MRIAYFLLIEFWKLGEAFYDTHEGFDELLIPFLYTICDRVLE